MGQHAKTSHDTSTTPVVPTVNPTPQKVVCTSPRSRTSSQGKNSVMTTAKSTGTNTSNPKGVAVKSVLQRNKKSPHHAVIFTSVRRILEQIYQRFLLHRHLVQTENLLL